MRSEYCKPNLGFKPAVACRVVYFSLTNIPLRVSYSNISHALKRAMSVCPSPSGKIQLRDEKGKGTMGCESGMGLSWRSVGGVRGGKWGNAKRCFRLDAPSTVLLVTEIYT